MSFYVQISKHHHDVFNKTFEILWFFFLKEGKYLVSDKLIQKVW